jgi:hexulose-6-phosphate isomerase
VKKGICILSFAPGTPIEDSIKMAKDAGFEGIELGIAEEGPLSIEVNRKEVERIRKVAEDVGLEVPSIIGGLYWANSLTSDDASVREKAMGIARSQLEITKIIGANTALVIPGCVWACFIPDCPVVPYDVAWERLLAAARELAPLAEENKVNIGFEIVWNNFLLSPVEFNMFLDQVGSPNVGLYMDTGNVVAFGFPEHWIRICGKHIKKVHLKDFKRGGGASLESFVDLLEGDVNWPEVIKALKEVGYDDYLTAEMLPPYVHFPEQRVYNASASMDKILSLA